MPRQSNGAYQQPAGTSAVFGEIIDPTAFNSLVADIGQETTNSLDRLGRGAMEAPLDMGGYAIQNVAAPTKGSDAVNRDYLSTSALGSMTLGTAGGTGDVITATFSPPITTLTNGLRLRFRSTDPNTLPDATFSPSGLAPKKLFTSGGRAVSPYDIPGKNFWVEVTFDTALNGVAGGWYLTPIQTAEPGTVRVFGMQKLPPGWVAMDGRELSRTVYANLFATIGTTFGAGDGSTTFTLPKVGGQALRFWDNAAGVDTGRVFGSLQKDALQHHAHGYKSAQGGSGGSGGGGLSSTTDSYTTDVYTGGSGDTAARVADETRMKNIALHAGMKV